MALFFVASLILGGIAYLLGMITPWLAIAAIVLVFVHVTYQQFIRSSDKANGCFIWVLSLPMFAVAAWFVSRHL
jgi:hypothetical protein